MPGQRLKEWQKKAIGKEIAAGNKTQEICQDWEISPQTITSIKKSQRALIEAEGQKYLQSLPDAVKVSQEHIKGIADGAINPTINPLQYKEGMKCVDMMLKAAGIVPSNSRSLHIQAIMLDKSSSILSKEVQDVLRILIPDKVASDGPGGPGDDEIIDVEHTELT